jgi:aromatic ring-cleaving dioxygenase
MAVAVAADLIEIGKIDGYHAHLYYDTATRGSAALLRQALADRFTVELGRWHDRPIGPHPQAMYQIAFGTAEFARLVPWLMLNRAGHTVLVHPRIVDDYEDHSRFALWLGPPLPLNLEALRASPG